MEGEAAAGPAEVGDAAAVVGPAEVGDAALPEAAFADTTPEEASLPKSDAEAAPMVGEDEPLGAEEGAESEEGETERPPADTTGEVSGAAAEEDKADEGGPEDAEGAVGGSPEEAERPPGEAEGPAEAGPPAEPVAEEVGVGEVMPREPSSEGLPTSASFEEGEPLLLSSRQVGEPRRISQRLRELEGLVSLERPEPGSPEEQISEMESEEDAELRLAEEQRQRAELVEQYRQLVVEQGRLRQYSARLQSKLAEVLNKAKGKEHPRGEPEQHGSDKEQHYGRYLTMLQELRSQQEQQMAWYQQQMDALQQACDQKSAKVNSQWKAYQAAKKEVAVYTMGRHLGGKQAAIQQVDQIQVREESKEKEMTEVRLENIKLKHRINKLGASLKAQEELAEGLHLIDFEQLKIENQTYNEKIEERNEELLKLRRKIINTVQVLTQVKEKLQFVEGENQGQKAQLIALEALVAQKRDILTKTKQVRDRLRIDNEKLHQKCGLLGDRVLLRDYEEKVDAAEALKERLETLKHQHAGLALTCEGVKKKIRGIKSFLPI